MLLTGNKGSECYRWRICCLKSVSHYCVVFCVLRRRAHATLSPCIDMSSSVTEDITHCCHCQYPNLLLVRDYHLRESVVSPCLTRDWPEKLCLSLLHSILYISITHALKKTTLYNADTHVTYRCIIVGCVLWFQHVFGSAQTLRLHFIRQTYERGQCSVVSARHYVRNGTVKTPHAQNWTRGYRQEDLFMGLSWNEKGSAASHFPPHFHCHATQIPCRGCL